MIVDILLVIAAFLLCFVGGAVGGFVAELIRGRSVLSRLESMENSVKGSAGRAVSMAKQERMQGAMLEAMQAFKEGKKPEEIMKEIGLKYPDVALDLGKKLMRGDIQI